MASQILKHLKTILLLLLLLLLYLYLVLSPHMKILKKLLSTDFELV